MSVVHVVGDDQPGTAERIGGKGRGLETLLSAGLRVPEAFVLTTDAFAAAVDGAVRAEVDALLADLGPSPAPAALEETAARVRACVVDGTAGHPGEQEVRDAYRALGERVGEEPAPVAVRSSSAAEDSATTSFAGEHDSYLWVSGADAVAEAVRRCWASLWTARAVSYRAHGRITGRDAMAVVVQRMVPARAAGVLMTLNPVTGDRSRVVVEAVWGLGEPLVSGAVTPDRFTLDKVTGDVVAREVAEKATQAVRDPAAGGVGTAEVDAGRREQPCLDDAELAELLRVGRALERHAGCPQDAEFAVAEPGGAEQVYLVQARPETVWTTRRRTRSGPAGAGAVSAVVERLTRPVPSVAEPAAREDRT